MALMRADLHTVTDLINQFQLEELGNESVISQDSSKIEISLSLSPRQTLISSTPNLLKKFRKFAKSNHKVSSVITQSSLGFHTHYLSSVKDEFSSFLENLEFQNPRYKIYSNATARICEDIPTIKRNLVDHFDHPVLMQSSLENFADEFLSVENFEKSMDCFDIGSDGFMSKCVKETLLDTNKVPNDRISFTKINSF